MTNEIKEILQLIGSCCYYGKISEDECEKYHNYITNLQEENERLKEENKRIFSKVNDDELLISNAMNYAEAQDYKQRIDKAIKKIEKDAELIDLEDGYNTCMAVIDILRGDE